ncbi:MAG: hypothetical protein US50_C0026G0005 [Candidatus Nomurabacteria bacterium GW2011_GWB1_37_5]|uniref:Uncharacterized protein n=1 Tax=Candidatus Nomurabacteria bacterium GW2011_GWB1_37_5 TaxID=1618742 RepID=A0A0G0K360_9BACT|nr:MAG: hypothetical protein US50_C0026G0005 [Candidatus Nomurabacteria bacterium GW2011_GWB1_37_5]
MKKNLLSHIITHHLFTAFVILLAAFLVIYTVISNRPIFGQGLDVEYVIATDPLPVGCLPSDPGGQTKNCLPRPSITPGTPFSLIDANKIVCTDIDGKLETCDFPIDTTAPIPVDTPVGAGIGVVSVAPDKPAYYAEGTVDVTARVFEAKALSSAPNDNKRLALDISPIDKRITFVTQQALEAEKSLMVFDGVNETTFFGENTGASNTGSQNFAAGYQAFTDNTSGSLNTAVGTSALANNISGGNNTAVGYRSGFTVTGGSNNTFMGVDAGYFNNASNNTYIGNAAGTASTIGAFNTFVGAFAGQSVSTGDNNTLLGTNVAGNLTSGDDNVILGFSSGSFLSTQINNVIIGSNAAQNASGNSMVIIGKEAGTNNVDDGNLFIGTSAGKSNVSGGINQVFIGFEAGNNNTTGSSNTFVGYQAGLTNTDSTDNAFFGALAGLNADGLLGGSNSFFGSSAGESTTTGGNNVFVGTTAGFSNTTGSENTIIGSQANVGGIGLTNATAIGSLAFVSASNSLVLGSINGVNGAINDTNVGIGTSSPTYLLEINGNGGVTPLFGATDGAGNGLTIQNDGVTSFNANTFNVVLGGINSPISTIGMPTSAPSFTSGGVVCVDSVGAFWVDNAAPFDCQ